ncbi:DUF881 domain-containing protein [Nocardioides sp. AE5]|uniref:DUF881 domain-containing protein n=1 Tax=Nocardioides sp. AE5 TaxID=2962573 RepID=UPI0028812D8F|nr:DUF881 domain-containing protein [Nocardioides sp. AE5]MDT0202388.1 DUF881 domain-containing protein [Nocardioides sp. AE5]
MAPLSHARHPDPPSPGDGSGTRTGFKWRIGTPVIGLLAGSIFVVSAVNSDADQGLRAGQVTDLASLVRSESAHVAQKQARANELTEEVDRLSASIDDDDVRTARGEAAAMEDPAGFREVSGQALTVVLADAPAELREGHPNINQLVVHQQDIQAVVNAMWAGGAEAIMIQGQRIISTTGIKCAGNSVELQGIPYPQPFVITAIGDPEAMQLEIDNDFAVSLYRADAANPDVQMGWEMDVDEFAIAPAYTGLRNLNYAQPLE